MRASFFNRYDSVNSSSDESVSIVFNGPLLLHSDPILPLHVATKRFVDNLFGGNLDASNLTSGIVSSSTLPAFSGDIVSSIGGNNFTLSNSGTSVGNFTKVTVDQKGRITNGATLTNADVPSLPWSKITSGKPTTVAGYGIEDAILITGDSLVDTVKVTGPPVSPLHAVNKDYLDERIESFNPNDKISTIIEKASSTAPIGYLRCNGAWVDKITYADLYSVLGDRYDSGIIRGLGKPWVNQSGTGVVGTTFGDAKTATPTTVESTGGVLAATDTSIYNATSSGVYRSVLDVNGMPTTWVKVINSNLSGTVLDVAIRNNVLHILATDGSGRKIHTLDLTEGETNSIWTMNTNTLPTRYWTTGANFKTRMFFFRDKLIVTEINRLIIYSIAESGSNIFTLYKERVLVTTSLPLTPEYGYNDITLVAKKPNEITVVFLVGQVYTNGNITINNAGDGIITGTYSVSGDFEFTLIGETTLKLTQGTFPPYVQSRTRPTANGTNLFYTNQYKATSMIVTENYIYYVGSGSVEEHYWVAGDIIRYNDTYTSHNWLLRSTVSVDGVVGPPVLMNNNGGSYLTRPVVVKGKLLLIGGILSHDAVDTSDTGVSSAAERDLTIKASPPTAEDQTVAYEEYTTGYGITFSNPTLFPIPDIAPTFNGNLVSYIYYGQKRYPV